MEKQDSKVVKFVLVLDPTSDPPGAFTEERGLAVAEYMNANYGVIANFVFNTETFELLVTNDPNLYPAVDESIFKQSAEAYLEGYCAGFSDGTCLRLKEPKRGRLP